MIFHGRPRLTVRDLNRSHMNVLRPYGSMREIKLHSFPHSEIPHCRPATSLGGMIA